MEKKWWLETTAYQVYPKSFYDSDGDGTGDLRGIIRKLDYLQKLGIGLLWLSPVYCSPMADQGYDISDYYAIDPRFGTMEDMEELIREGKKRGIGILMDLVVNHCSDEHEWFRKALEDPEGRYGKYFYIEEGRDGKPPCNWRSYFGGSVWEKIPGTEKYYLHLFHRKQPDLNWENPEVREAIYQMVNWWLDKGIAGFRIDAIINIKKALPFRDYPADRPDGLCSVQNMLKEARGIGVFLTELKKRAFEPHQAFTVGEVFDEKEEELPDFIGDGGYFSSMFDFGQTVLGKSEKGWYASRPVTAEMYKKSIFSMQAKARDIGFLSNIIENHDEPRGVSHYIPGGGTEERSKKMLALVLMMRRGLPFIYQGQEIGMENVPFRSVGEIDDVSTLDEYQVCLDAGLSPDEALETVSRFSRDNARTPMQWDNSENAGFTRGKPWLPVNPQYRRINVAEQLGRDDSLFYFYRRMIELRKNPEYQEAVAYGVFRPVLEEQENIIAFYRTGGGKCLLMIANYQNSPQSVQLPGKLAKVLLNNYDRLKISGEILNLEGYQSVLLDMEKNT